MIIPDDDAHASEPGGPRPSVWRGSAGAGFAVALGELKDVLAHQLRGAIAVLIEDGLVDAAVLGEIPITETLERV